jgi:hypothetical protein
MKQLHTRSFVGRGRTLLGVAKLLAGKSASFSLVSPRTLMRSFSAVAPELKKTNWTLGGMVQELKKLIANV